jgi:hypothetical protein
MEDQLNKNIIAFEKINEMNHSQNNNFIQWHIHNNNLKLYQEKKVSIENKKLYAKKYNKLVAYFRRYQPDLLIRDCTTLNFLPIIKKQEKKREIIIDPLTGNERTDEKIFLRVSRKYTLQFDSFDMLISAFEFYSNDAELDTFMLSEYNITQMFGTFENYCLKFNIKSIDSDNNWIFYSNSNIFENLFNKKNHNNDFFWNNLEENKEKVNSFFVKKIIKKLETKHLINPLEYPKIYYCTDQNCKYYTGFIDTNTHYQKLCKCKNIYCYHELCSECGNSYHGNYECSLNIDELSSIAIETETKPCPVCNTRISKIDGCNHMTCTICNPITHFCWECLQVTRIFPHNNRLTGRTCIYIIV